jgi:Clp amino terminal domain, pathogenicity island component
VFERFTQPAYRVVELANQEADRLRHGYLGPEHVLVGIVRQADSPAGRVLRARGLDLEAVRGELDRLVERGILPGPERNHAALLGSLGVDLEAVRRAAEEAFGQEAVGQATWRVSRRRWWRGGGPGWTPLCGKAAVAKRALQLASAEADALASTTSVRSMCCSGWCVTRRSPSGDQAGTPSECGPLWVCWSRGRVRSRSWWSRAGCRWKGCGKGSWQSCTPRSEPMIIGHLMPCPRPLGQDLVRMTRLAPNSEGDNEMGKVTTGGTMSLDGYIAGPEESGFDLLFQWYGNGDVEIPSASPDVPPPRISAASAELIKPEWENTGALVVGRHLYDMTNAWGGRHPMNVTTVVLTHRRPGRPS